MATDKKTRDLYALIAVGLCFSILIAANFLADRKFARWDLTAEGHYSLSNEFKKVMDKIEHPVQLTYYVSGSVPPDFVTKKRDILDKLGEIQTASKGLLELKIIDPEEDKKARKQLEEKGLALQTSTQEKDKKVNRQLFTAVRIVYGNKPASWISLLTSAEDLEYLLANKILELTIEEKPIIAIGFPRPAVPTNPAHRNRSITGYEWIQQEMSKDSRIDLREVYFTETNSIPDNTQLLILIRPKNLSYRANYEINKYLAEGGNVLLMGNSYLVDRQHSDYVEKQSMGIEDILKECGVGFRGKYLCDTHNIKLSYMDRYTGKPKYVPRPNFVRVLGANIDQRSFLTRYLPSLIMPFPDELVLDEGKIKEQGLNLNVLARTSEESWTEPLTEFAQAKEIKKGQKFEGRKPVYIMLDGKFPFLWKNRKVPAWPEPTPKGARAADKAREGNNAPMIPTEEDGRAESKPGVLLIWSAPDAFSMFYRAGDYRMDAMMQGNNAALSNALAHFTHGDDLVRMRAKLSETRSIMKLDSEEEATKRNLIKLLLVGGVPVLLILFAFGRWFLRRNSQNAYERKFAKTTGPSSFSS